MKTLITQMRDQLASSLTYLGGDKAVHLLPDEDVLPETTPFPCVGIKDGPVTNEHTLGLRAPVKYLTVDIIAYVLINAPDGVLIGKGSQKGVLDLLEDVRGALEHWSPSDYLWMGGSVRETASGYMTAGEDRLVQKKKITMTWSRRAD